MIRLWPALIGLGMAAAALLMAIADARAALAGWLAGFVFWSALPIGALGLVMMIRLIPGGWGRELAFPAETALMLLPLAVAAALPMMLGADALYPWPDVAARTGLRAVYLTPWFFVARSVAAFTAFLLIAYLLLTRPAWSSPVASAGLIAFTLIDTILAVDWLMSLDPEFHSSGFGLYVLSIQMTIALTLLIFLHLLGDDPATRIGLLGGLLLTALLLWAYVAFMQYVIIWSGNLPQGVSWYARHAAGLWSTVEEAIGALHLVPAFLLLFLPVRRSRRWLIILAIAVLTGKALECLWLVLPTVNTSLRVALPAAALAFGGLGLLTLAGLRFAAFILEQRSSREAAS
ncbi:MAG: hypothetical protein WBP94_00465 [Rhodomicrobiaceae bacterium]